MNTSLLIHSVSVEAISDLESERDIIYCVIYFHCEVLKKKLKLTLLKESD